MKKITILCLLFLFAGTTIFAQQEEDKKAKKVIIITETVDDDGNVKTEKIIKEVNGRDVIIMKNSDGETIHTEHNVNVDVDDNGVEKRIKIRIDKGEGDEDVEIMEWEGEGEMPADLLKKLEEKGINIEMNEGDENVFIFDSNDAPNNACLGVMIGMKKTVENINGEETTTTSGESDLGVPILDIIEDSGAEDAGLATDDIITSINGTTVATMQDLLDVLSPLEDGGTVEVAYLRDGATMQTTATLKACGQSNVIISDEDFEWEDENGNDVSPNGKRWMFIEEDGNKNSTRKIIIKKKKKDGTETIEEIGFGDEDEIDLSNEGERSLDLETIDIFPNPTDGKLTVKFKAPNKPTTVKITDISGKEVYKEEINNFSGNYNEEIDLSNAPNGALILSIQQDDKVFSEKLILQR